MARISGTYRETHIANIAAMIVLIDAHLTAENARMVALGGAATSITGSLTLTVTAEDGANVSYDHKITITLNCPNLAALTPAALTAALSVFATAIETESSFTTVTEVSVGMNTVMTN